MGKYALDKEQDEETLSFATMACHANHSPESRPKPSPPGDPFFEFQTSPEPSCPPSPADVLFSNGRLLPENKSPEDGEKDDRNCQKVPAGNRCGSRKLTVSASKRVSFQLRGQEEAGAPPVEDKRALMQARNGSRQGQTVAAPVAPAPARKKAKGRRGVLGFFMTSCRVCQAMEPSSQVMKMRSLHACSLSTYNYGRKTSRPASPDIVFELGREK